MTAYYNENDAFAAAWLRALIAEGAIAPGEVDERDIRDVRPVDLLGFHQHHWFAGIGVWSYALRAAGWPDDLPVWTGSCPCQPFSAAGKRAGVADERHLWPSWFHLVDQCRPSVVLGEQVASKDGLAWFDTVSADLEGAAYSVGATDSCAAGVGAPHIRQRLWFAAIHQSALARYVDGWLGDARLARLEGHARHGGRGGQPGWVAPRAAGSFAEAGSAGRVAFARRFGALGGLHAPLGDRGSVPWLLAVDVAPSHGPYGGLADPARQLVNRRWTPRPERRAEYPDHGPSGGLADADAARRAIVQAARLHAQGAPRHDDDGRRGPRGLGDPGGVGRSQGWPGDHPRHDGPQLAPVERAGGLADTGSGFLPLAVGGTAGRDGPRPDGALARCGPTNGFWSVADWLHCRDGKWRAVEPGTLPLATGIAGRVGRLRGYGNALNAEAARIFIEALTGRGELQ